MSMSSRTESPLDANATFFAAYCSPSFCITPLIVGRLCHADCMVQMSYRCGLNVFAVYVPTPTSMSTGRPSENTTKLPTSLWL